MFVSSYSTYISANTNDKITKPKFEQKKDEANAFNSILKKGSPLQAYSPKNMPIDYISNYKSLNNQQKLQEQVKSKDEIKFKKINDTKNAKVAYESNTSMFSLMRIPSSSLDLTPQISSNYPQNIQDVKEDNLRYKMVNTYLANDKYYQITA